MNSPFLNQGLRELRLRQEMRYRSSDWGTLDNYRAFPRMQNTDYSTCH